MEQAKYTKGDWFIQGKTLIKCQNEQIGSVNSMIDEYEANAKLLATAPELLETLIGTMKALSRMIDKHDPDSIEAEWIGNANETIIKATRI